MGGLDIPMLFDSFAPTFTAPISTTVDLNVATRFSKTTGVILEMKQGSGRPAFYLDVEWLSNYEFERERLFFDVHVGRLYIKDVQSWHGRKKFVNYEFIKAMTLFSALFCGHYLLDLCNKSNQRILCAFLQCFNANNNLKSKGQIFKIDFSLFLEQIFFNLVHKVDKLIVIRQEFEKLSDELKNELFLVKDNKVLTSPFVEYLIKTNEANIELM